MLEPAHAGQLLGLALSRSGQLLISAGQQTGDVGGDELVVWKRAGETYREAARLPQHSSPRQLSISRDQTRLYVAYADRSYAAWYLPALAR